MSDLLDRRAEEWAIWFHKNVDRIPYSDLRKRAEFQEIMIDGLLELIVTMAKDLQRLEGRSGPGFRTFNGLIIPKNIKAL